ncbi:NrdG Organic radical activating enzymes [uncultured Caudovirales phage]|uniref:NrdG Organic radical activating enzymes n=1 Tax=uncultured Caudovirales phage TaxID=2100421 RepID=A0A6J7WSD3_9CAUD|nr:NrdG Organic radical activating enzymes [uncultured Caudovirales phage]
MSKIKVAELFYSLQGEGQYLGTPSIFLRVFGCNFQCAGFSMSRGQLSSERLNIDPAAFDSYDSLPLVHTGCDSYASWDVRFKKLSPMLEVSAIVDRIQELLPDGKFSEDKHLILTGGEPLLGWQKSYIELFEEIKKREMGLKHITFETNGTQEINADLARYLTKSDIFTTFSISSKLPSSGESWEDAIKPDVIDQYMAKVWNSQGYFKWVVSNEDDYQDVVRAVEAYGKVIGDYMMPVYLMPAGGTTMHYNDNERWVADLAMKHGWRYTPRLQVQLWKNAWGT